MEFGGDMGTRAVSDAVLSLITPLILMETEHQAGL
jgi:hypothetical protein